jgi:ketosteroid isomerase-like protein
VSAVNVVPRRAGHSIDVVRRWQQSLDSGGIDAAWWALHEQITVRVPASLPHGGTWNGHAGFREMITSFRSTWRFDEPLGFTLRDIADDVVGVFAQGAVHSVETGRPARISTAEFLRVESGQIVSIDVYYEDTAQIVAAVRP